MWPDTEGNHATSDEQPLRESGLRPSRLSPFFFSFDQVAPRYFRKTNRRLPKYPKCRDRNSVAGSLPRFPLSSPWNLATRRRV